MALTVLCGVTFEPEPDALLEAEVEAEAEDDLEEEVACTSLSSCCSDHFSFALIPFVAPYVMLVSDSLLYSSRTPSTELHTSYDEIRQTCNWSCMNRGHVRDRVRTILGASPLTFPAALNPTDGGALGGGQQVRRLPTVRTGAVRKDAVIACVRPQVLGRVRPRLYAWHTWTRVPHLHHARYFESRAGRTQSRD